MSVDLRRDAKGAHLSRFVEVLHDSAGRQPGFGVADPPLLRDATLGRRGRRLEFSFPYFLAAWRPSPGSAALHGLPVPPHRAALEDSVVSLALTARVPVTSVCPCSKAISDYGAHNQRGRVTIERIAASRDGCLRRCGSTN